MAERVGFFRPTSQNANEDGPLSLKPHDRSDLSSSDPLVGFCLFASACESCQRDDTQNDTRRERLPESSPRTGMSERTRNFYAVSSKTSTDTNSGRRLGKHSFPLSSTIFQAA